jgi:hypothetical protein
MPRALKEISGGLKREYEQYGPKCIMIPYKITSLSDYFEVFNSVLKKEKKFWLRGHGDFTWNLTPSALRYKRGEKRNRALNLLFDFKRFVEIKLSNPPGSNEELKWVQLAQHYGLPTRLLDWTQNASIALYFACLEPEKNGLVFVLNPVDLNKESDPQRPRVFNVHQDADLIEKYLKLSGNRDPKGLKTIAIHPTWNSERIMIQQGVFTLHGSRDFILTGNQAPSLAYLPIPRNVKQSLLRELDRVGVCEMSIFPESEHVCRYLKWREHLL